MASYPISSTVFELSRVIPDFCRNDFFYCADGDGLYPEHHYKMTWMAAEPFCQGLESGIAIDVACRDGEFTRYLMPKFSHVYCFDLRRMQRFADYVEFSKVTHFTCAIGDEKSHFDDGRVVGCRSYALCRSRPRRPAT